MKQYLQIATEDFDELDIESGELASIPSFNVGQQIEVRGDRDELIAYEVISIEWVFYPHGYDGQELCCVVTVAKKGRSK